jgi:1-aminocyclopropane-1-carboxylate deaminase
LRGFSNHIAVAHAGKENGFKTIGIVRGDELRDKIAENLIIRSKLRNATRVRF